MLGEVQGNLPSACPQAVLAGPEPYHLRIPQLCDCPGAGCKAKTVFEWARPSPARRVSLGNQPSACPQAVLAGPGPPLTHTHTHKQTNTHICFCFFVPLTSRGSCHERPCTNYPLRRPHKRKGGGISPTDGTYARSNAKNEWPFSRPTRQKLLQGIPGHQGPRTPKTQNYQTNKHTHTQTSTWFQQLLPG